MGAKLFFPNGGGVGLHYMYPWHQADFASLLNLCGWDKQINLEEDFWVFILILLYLGTNSRALLYIYT